jgi:hypothetical protein
MSIFSTNVARALDELKSDRLVHAAGTYLGGVLPSDPALTRKLYAAEAEASRKLGVPLEETMIFADEPTADELSVLDGMPYKVEPGYDLPADFFGRQSWGFLALRVRPVIDVESIRFVYPSVDQTLYTVPKNWIRVDKKYGQLHIIPGPGAGNMPVSIFMIQAVSGGTNVPHAIRVKYRAGLDCSLPENGDVVDLVMQMAVLRVVQDAFSPSSGSISADGLSQSVSVDVGKLQDDIDNRIGRLKESIKGLVWGVL